MRDGNFDLFVAEKDKTRRERRGFALLFNLGWDPHYIYELEVLEVWSGVSKLKHNFPVKKKLNREHFNSCNISLYRSG
jgi:hypothetical protein